MPRNSVGTYTLPQAPFVPNTTISSSAVNSDLSDIASALTSSIASNGVTPITSPIKFTSGTSAAPGITFTSDASTGVYLPGSDKIGLAAGGDAALVMDMNRAGTGQDGSILQYGNGAIPNPVGMVQDFAGSTAPTGWFLCYGQAVSRTSYPELFTVIGTTYGVGDGSSTFNLPDLRGRVVAGKDDMGGTSASRLTATYFGTSAAVLGASGGVQSQTLITANLPAYTPSGSVNINDPSHSHTSNDAGAKNTQANGFSGSGSSGNIWVLLSSSATSSNTTGITASFSGDAQGGSSSSFAVVPPALILNKIIFAGRA